MSIVPGHVVVLMSPPSRVEWIEILLMLIISRLNASPPSRVEWIEMIRCYQQMG